MSLLLLWKVKFALKIQQMREEIIGFFIIKQEVKKNTWLRLAFSPTLLPVCFIREQSTVQASLFVK